MLEGYLTLKTILLGGAVFLLVFNFIRYLQRRHLRLPPGPTPLPLIGNLLKFTANDNVHMFKDLRRQYGPVVSLWLGPHHTVILNTIEVVTEAMLKTTDFAGRPYFPSMEAFSRGGKGLAFGEYGPLLSAQRKIAHGAIRAFTEGDKLGDAVLENFKSMSSVWTNRTEPFDPREDITLFIVDIITSVTFAKTIARDSPEFHLVFDNTREVNEILGNGFFTDFLPSWMSFLERTKLDVIKKFSDNLVNIAMENIKEHRESFDADNLRDLTDHVIDVQLKAADGEDSNIMSKLTEEHFAAIISDIFSASTETMRESLLSLLLYVGVHPEVQKKMAEELDEVVGRGRVPEFKDVTKLKYCEAVAFETLRVNSAIPMSIPHKTLCDTSVGGYDVPKDSVVLVNLLELHFDPEHWTNPDEFNPDRFIEEDGNLYKPRAWMPFSTGRRVCPGEFLAKRELVYIAALIFHQFSMTIPDVPEEPLEPAYSSIIQRVPKAFEVTLTERN